MLQRPFNEVHILKGVSANPHGASERLGTIWWRDSAIKTAYLYYPFVSVVSAKTLAHHVVSCA